MTQKFLNFFDCVDFFEVWPHLHTPFNLNFFFNFFICVDIFDFYTPQTNWPSLLCEHPQYAILQFLQLRGILRILTPPPLPIQSELFLQFHRFASISSISITHPKRHVPNLRAPSIRNSSISSIAWISSNSDPNLTYPCIQSTKVKALSSLS